LNGPILCILHSYTSVADFSLGFASLSAIPVLVFGLIFAVILRILEGSETRWEHLSVPFVFQGGGFSIGGQEISLGG